MTRVCVYCGSREGTDPVFARQTVLLANALASRGLGVVFGGGRVGLMGVLADAVLAAGGEVIGVIPEHLSTVELIHPDVTEMRVVGSMHERKAMMMDLSDAFIALPGGFGTMEELFEVLCWRQIGLHSWPVGLLEVDGFYSGLRQLLSRMVSDEFLCSEPAGSLIIDEDVDTLIDRLQLREPCEPR